MDLFSRMKVIRNGRIDVKMLRTLIHDQDQHIRALQQQLRDVDNEKMEMQASHSALEQDIGKLDAAERDPKAIKRLENYHVGIMQKQDRERALRVELATELAAQDEIKGVFSRSFDAVVDAQVPLPRDGRFDWSGALDSIVDSISTSKPRVSAGAEPEADAAAAASAMQELALALESIMPAQAAAARESAPPPGFMFVMQAPPVLPPAANSNFDAAYADNAGSRAAPAHAATDRNQPAPAAPAGGYSFKETKPTTTAAGAHGVDRGEAA